MATSQIRIKTEGFRAIGQAEIVINGITVVAGENGSGKSTLSKLLYHLYKTVSNYELLVAREARVKLNNVYRFLDIAQHELNYSSIDKSFRQDIDRELRVLRRNLEKPLNEQSEAWLSVIKKTSAFYASRQIDLFSNEGKVSKRMDAQMTRLRFIMKDILREEQPEENNFLPFDEIAKYVDAIFKEAEGKLKSRQPLCL